MIPIEIRKKYPKWIHDILNSIFPLHYVNEIISSQLDVDRLDYLLRDAYMCGVEYGNFDLDWILKNIFISEIPPENNRKGMVINAEKGIFSIESFIISRYHMYEQVYFHKTTRAAEKLMENIFLRLKELYEADKRDAIGKINESVLKIFEDDFDVKDYLYLDDFLTISYINELSRESNDDILKRLCSNFVNRNLYKLIDEAANVQLFNREQYRYISSFSNEKSLEEKYFFVEDDFTDVPYKDDYLYGKERSEDSENIWLLLKNNWIRDLAEVSEIIRALRNNVNIKYRGYFDRDYYEDFINNFPGYKEE